MCRFILGNYLSFGIDRKSLWYDGVTHCQWYSVVQMGSGNGESCYHCCIMYYLYRWPTPSSPSNKCRVLCNRCLGKFTGVCGWYGVTNCTHGGNCSSDTKLEVCHAYAGPHDIVYSTTKTENSMYASRTKAITGWVLKKSHARKWRTYLCRRKCFSGSSYLHQWRQKSNCSSHIVTQFMDVIFGVVHTRTLLEKLLLVIVTHSNELL